MSNGETAFKRVQACAESFKSGFERVKLATIKDKKKEVEKLLLKTLKKKVFYVEDKKIHFGKLEVMYSRDVQELVDKIKELLGAGK